MIGVRKLNRSQKFDIGGKTIAPATGAAGTGAGASMLVNLDNPRVARDVARHTTLGALITGTTVPFFQNDDGVVTGGGTVATRATGLVCDVAGGTFTRASGATGTITAGTVTVGTADVTNPRVDTVVVDTTSGAVSLIAGTATTVQAGGTAIQLAGRAAVPANRIVLAYIVVPAAATNLAQTAVVDARP